MLTFLFFCSDNCLAVSYTKMIADPPTDLRGDSISRKTPYLKISQSLEGTRSVVSIIQLLWNLADVSAALLLSRLSNFKAIQIFWHPISRLWDFARSYDKNSSRTNICVSQVDHHWFKQRLVACTKPLSKPKRVYRYIYPWEEISVKLNQKSLLAL